MMNFWCCLALCINSVHSNLSLRLTNRALMYSASDILNFVFICWPGCERKPWQAWNMMIFFSRWFVVNETVILSEISMFPGSETIPGQEISLGIRIWPGKPFKTMKHWENENIEKNSRKHHNSSNFRPWKYIFALLTQQIMWIATPGE